MEEKAEKLVHVLHVKYLIKFSENAIILFTSLNFFPG